MSKWVTVKGNLPVEILREDSEGYKIGIIYHPDGDELIGMWNKSGKSINDRADICRVTEELWET